MSILKQDITCLLTLKSCEPVLTALKISELKCGLKFEIKK